MLCQYHYADATMRKEAFVSILLDSVFEYVSTRDEFIEDWAPETRTIKSIAYKSLF
jgi:hypothetical protein